MRDYQTGTWEGGDGSECEHAASPRRGSGTYSETSTLGPDRNGLGPDNAAWKVTAQQYRHTCDKCGAVRVDRQIGLEARHDCLGWATGNRCGECHVCVIVDVFRLVREVLADDGVVFLNYGDSYAGSQQVGQNNLGASAASTRGGAKKIDGKRFDIPRSVPIGLKPKDLVGMPWRIALALQSDGWWLRSDIIWSKANPMPSSVLDRPTTSHEYLFLLAKKSRYFYDSEAVREPHADSTQYRAQWGNNSEPITVNAKGLRRAPATGCDPLNPAGRNRRSVWNIATEAFSAAHFATFPRKLVEPCILAGTSTYGHCPECGARWVRVVEKGELILGGTNKRLGDPIKRDESLSAWTRPGGKVESVIAGAYRETTTTGWRPTCDCCFGETESGMHYNPVPDIVLDPFFGSGTVGLVAEQLGRKYIGIELSEEYSKLAREDTKQEVMRL